MTTTKKPKLSRDAKLIVDKYFQDVAGGERFLSSDLKFAMLTAAMYYIMQCREDADSSLPTSHYTKTLREAATHLWPEEWAMETQ